MRSQVKTGGTSFSEICLFLSEVWSFFLQPIDNSLSPAGLSPSVLAPFRQRDGAGLPSLNRFFFEDFRALVFLLQKSFYTLIGSHVFLTELSRRARTSLETLGTLIKHFFLGFQLGVLNRFSETLFDFSCVWLVFLIDRTVTTVFPQNLMQYRL